MLSINRLNVLGEIKIEQPQYNERHCFRLRKIAKKMADSTYKSVWILDCKGAYTNNLTSESTFIDFETI